MRRVAMKWEYDDSPLPELNQWRDNRIKLIGDLHLIDPILLDV
jgi:hypothetical protein